LIRSLSTATSKQKIRYHFHDVKPFLLIEPAEAPMELQREHLPQVIGSFPRARRILYAADLNPGTTSTYRFEALGRLGQHLHPFNLRTFEIKNRALRWVRFRFPLGPLVSRVNRELVKLVETSHPDVVWFDKPIFFTPETMQAIKRTGAQIIFYVQDAPFGPRDDGCWLQFNKVFRMADLHCLVRRADVARYRAWQLPWIETMFSFDPHVHFPPHAGFSDAERNREVSYIGFPYEQRPAFLLKLARDRMLPVSINGDRWLRALSPEERKFFILGTYLADDEYRSGIWRSKVNLSFVTESNEDDIAHKAVEIAACAGFLLAFRTPGHQAIFNEDREAVFFSSVEECADKARFYLSRPDLRQTIATRGRDRAVRSGYDNDTQLARILKRLDGKQD
jgi:spore maturation protein CgeB